MDRAQGIRVGMQVFSTDDRLIGAVERVEGDAIHVNGRHIDNSQIARVGQGRVYLKGVYDELAGGMAATDAVGDRDAVRTPIYEERLDVDKRQGQIGEVAIHKTVEEEEVAIPVELRREEVSVHEREVEDRPVEAGALDDAFQERTIRVPVRGEEAVVEKRAYQTGEVVIEKEQTVDRQEIRDTVRRERVDIDDAYRRFQGDFQSHFDERSRMAGATGANRTFAEAEPNYRAGFEYGYDERYANQTFDQAEPHLRRDWEGQYGGRDRWEELREEIREGYNRARM
jgi:uncharacterized protein (TIGR02271 family)